MTYSLQHLQSPVVGSKTEVLPMKTNAEVINAVFVFAACSKVNTNVRLASLHPFASVQG